jgi:hypothetical protein
VARASINLNQNQNIYLFHLWPRNLWPQCKGTHSHCVSLPHGQSPLPTKLHQENIHLLENGLKALKTAFERSKSSQAV